MEKEPAGQSKHEPKLEAPDAAEYEPAGQLIQQEADAGEYVPAGQTAHRLTLSAPGFNAKVPALQLRHSEESGMTCIDEYFPAGQSLHVLLSDAPEAVEYLPFPHGVQSLDSTAAPVLYVPGTHLTHVSLLGAPMAPENVPKGQDVQLSAPASENVVWSQKVHALTAMAPN